MAKKLRMKEKREVGLKFINFLKDGERLDETCKETLKRIYNYEFRGRDGVTSVNFSSVLFALSRVGKARVTGDEIFFDSQRRKVVYANQYPKRWFDPADNLGTTSPPALVQEPGKKGRAKAIIQQLKRNSHQMIQNKGGVKIWSDFDIDNGKIRVPLALNDQKPVPIYIKNEGVEAVTFVRCEMLRRLHVFTLRDEKNVTNSQQLVLSAGESYQIEIICSMADSGYFPVTLVFQFQDGSSSPFHIIRFFSARVNNRLIEELMPIAPYKPYQLCIKRLKEEIVEQGVKPAGFSDYKLEMDIPLGNYKYPPILLNAVKSGLKESRTLNLNVSQEVQRINSLLASKLEFDNYDERFRLLLHLEEIQMEVDITRYNMDKVTMVRDQQMKDLLVLQVPGVAENRPSVLRGDHLFVSKSDDPGEPITRYKGYVHAVELEKVKLGFSKKLVAAFINKLKFNVSFTFNRTPLRLQHRAAQLAKDTNLKDMLFPVSSAKKCIHSFEKNLTFYDRSLENNPEQATAVNCIVSGLSRPAPYLVFGPPGTGKTVTIVEAIKQECSSWNESERRFEFPSKETLKQYRVITTTLTTAGRLASAKFPHGHFSHVFIDEAGHAVEPESVIAIAGLLDVMDSVSNEHGGQLVLAGDPKQLGPVLRSPIAIKHGLDLSLLERLMSENTLYQKSLATDSYNNHFVTKLLCNYRSHPDILKIPNELFYDNELKMCANELIRQSYCEWQHLPKMGFPVIFHGVLGEDQREEKSPSFFNADEIDKVLFYLKKLLTNQGKKGVAMISPKEIGVISPYRKQVEKIRKAINKIDKELMAMADIRELKVGSVEEFQGQERKVIIISTVRSSSNYLQMDEDFNLGFLNNPKRFNVALTRAKALLIVVGNPIILRKDPNWKRFLNYCVTNRAYTGYEYDSDDLESDFLDRLGQLSLDTEPTADPDVVSVIQQQLEPEWRSEV
ncbi:putative helicase MOV-10 isoform X4 [Carcharodon carcharias]|uniref:putative helicase MOV-10 isoform X4 n=1 Tax=Carcharodon carcharias TaxID=13397 RepID=UPI001B7D97C9|nr:putative helicase MOV-10 isoform X4 [Carcharodon carcharias]